MDKKNRKNLVEIEDFSKQSFWTVDCPNCGALVISMSDHPKWIEYIECKECETIIRLKNKESV
jgi:transcription elongation factor Elf1